MKKSLQLILGISVLLLFTPSICPCQGYFVSVAGSHFVGIDQAEDYWHQNGTVLKPSSGGYLEAPVIFPDALKYIERMSITFYDFNAAGQIFVFLYKKNRWTGDTNLIATCSTGFGDASTDVKTTSVILGLGRGINNANYSYYVEAQFYNVGGNINELRLHSVTFKCQPH